MEHTISLLDSKPPAEAPASEFELPSSYESSFDEQPAAEAYEAPANLHPFPTSEAPSRPDNLLLAEHMLPSVEYMLPWFVAREAPCRTGRPYCLLFRCGVRRQLR